MSFSKHNEIEKNPINHYEHIINNGIEELDLLRKAIGDTQLFV